MKSVEHSFSFSSTPWNQRLREKNFEKTPRQHIKVSRN